MGAEMSSRVQEVLPRGANREAVYRSQPGVQDRLYLRTAVHWVWDLPEEVSVWRNPHYQLAHQPRLGGHASVLRQQLQASPTPHAASGSGAGTGGNQRYWKEYGIEGSEWEVEA